MTTRIYSTLDSSAVGPGLFVDSSLTVVTTNANATDRHRKVLGTVPKGAGSGAFEVYVWSDKQDPLADRVAIGIAAPNSPLDKAVGEDNLSYAYLPGTGAIAWNNAGLIAAQQSAERVCIGVYVDVVGLAIRWYANGNPIAKLALPTAMFWVPALTVSGGDAGNLRASLNAQGPLDYPYVELF